MWKYALAGAATELGQSCASGRRAKRPRGHRDRSRRRRAVRLAAQRVAPLPSARLSALVSRRARLRRPSCGCIGTGVAALACAPSRSIDAMARSPAPRTIVDLRMVTEPGSERASCLDHGARPECSLFRHGHNGAPGRPPHHRVAPKHDRAAPERRRQCFHGNAPGDDRRSVPVLDPAAPLGRAWAVSPARTTWRSPSRPRLRLDHVADAAPRLHEVVDLAPPGHQPPRRMSQRAPASSLSTRRTVFPEPAAT